MPDKAPDKPTDFTADVAAVGKQYPALAPYLGDVQVQYGNPSGPNDPRQLEFYSPWEDTNPNKGKTTLEIYKRDMVGPDLQSAIAGDMLHLLGSVDPRTGRPIDPHWMEMKNQLIKARTPKHDEIDRRAYQEELQQYDEKPTYEDWMQRNRGDAYIRGYITPDKVDEWRKNGFYTPEMSKVLDQMKQYLSTPPVHTLFTSPRPEGDVTKALKKEAAPNG